MRASPAFDFKVYHRRQVRNALVLLLSGLATVFGFFWAGMRACRARDPLSQPRDKYDELR